MGKIILLKLDNAGAPIEMALKWLEQEKLSSQSLALGQFASKG